MGEDKDQENPELLEDEALAEAPPAEAPPAGGASDSPKTNGTTEPVRVVEQAPAGEDTESEAVSKAEKIAETAIKAREEREEHKQKDEQARKLGLLARIQRLDVGERAKLARGGDKESRSILIKDSNKLVAMSVLSNPKITIQEIEIIAASRNVGDEILKEVANNKDWCKSYAVMHALVNNPKTPIPASLTFLPKLLTNHLRTLAKSKGVPEAVRVTARRLAEKRKF